MPDSVQAFNALAGAAVARPALLSPGAASRRAAPRSPAPALRLYSDVQPGVLARLCRSGSTESRVCLLQVSGAAPQAATLRVVPGRAAPCPAGEGMRQERGAGCEGSLWRGHRCQRDAVGAGLCAAGCEGEPHVPPGARVGPSPVAPRHLCDEKAAGGRAGVAVLQPGIFKKGFQELHLESHRGEEYCSS